MKALLLVVLLAGCYSYKPLTDPDPQSEPVRVRFARATEVRLTGANASSIVAVRELSGIVTGVLGDSIRLVVDDGEDARGRDVADGTIAMIPRSANPIIERRRLSASRSYLAVLGGLVATYVVYVLVGTRTG
jgi:hypothetical protein